MAEALPEPGPPPRLLRHTPGTIEPLGQNAAYRFAAQHALVHYRSGSVFTFIPKNACTSLRVSLAIANGAIADTRDWTWVHNNNGTFTASLPDLARAPATAVILRCPFKRLASVFLDKIVSRGGELWTLHRMSRDTLDPDRLTFRSFVEWIGKPGFLRADIHWSPQNDFLVYAAYDRVFGMDDLADFGAFFAKSTGQALVDARPFSGHTTSTFEPLEGESHADTPLSELTLAKSQGRLPAPRTLYDVDLVAAVYRLYEPDIALHMQHLGPAGLMFPPTPSEGQTCYSSSEKPARFPWNLVQWLPSRR